MTNIPGPGHPKFPETATCTDVSLLDTTEHEKTKEKENKCPVIKAGCAGTYINVPRRRAGAVGRSGQQGSRLMASKRSGSVGACFSMIDGLPWGSGVHRRAHSEVYLDPAGAVRAEETNTLQATRARADVHSVSTHPEIH